MKIRNGIKKKKIETSSVELYVGGVRFTFTETDRKGQLKVHKFDTHSICDSIEIIPNVSNVIFIK